MSINQGRVRGLADAIQAGRAVFVLGAGVTAASAASGGAGSWRDLIEGGIRFYKDHVAGFDATLVGSIRQDLELTDPALGAVHAAGKLTSALGGQDSPNFAMWLREAVGELELGNTELIDAIRAFELPIATVNYDTLVEKAPPTRVARTWTNPAEMQSALQGMTTDVAHLHGVWTEPKSVVFGGLSYGAVVADGASQALQRALGALRSIVFIGCGAGLADPNFEALRKWLIRTFPDARHEHYRLCLSSEVATLAIEHEGESIVPVAYGDSFGDLVPFLLNLQRKSVETAGNAVQRAVADLLEQVRTDCVFAQHLPDIGVRSIEQILVPPVVLPVSPEQFVEANRDEDGPKISRVDASKDVLNRDVIVLVADEGVGLTTALAWLVHRASQLRDGFVPLLVDYLNFSGRNALDRAIRKNLRSAQISIDNQEPLPKLALAVDNFLYTESEKSKTLVREIAALDSAIRIIGCRRGGEIALQQALADAGVNHVVRYLGRLNQRDIRDLVSLVAPADAQLLTQKAVQVIQREHLPRTPMTVGLLISVLISGEALLSTASETSLLDAYVQLLLGRGSVSDDARFALDSHELASLLGYLAVRYIQADTGGLDESVVIECFESYFATKGWNESASETLALLKAKHILVRRKGKVQFSQSSFLHLFAAKRAIRDESVRQKLLTRPHYYAESIKHIAALTRDDIKLLLRIGEFVEAEVAAMSLSTQRRCTPFSTHAVETNGNTDGLQSLLENLEAPMFYDGKAEDEAGGTRDFTEDSDPLDAVADDDDVAFPVLDLEQAPAVVRIIQILGLVSNVVRDSEEVEDLELKMRVLGSVLALWGRLVDAFSADEMFMEFMETLADHIEEEFRGDVAAAQIEKMRSRFLMAAPVLAAVGGMTLTLASRKLFLMLRRVFEDSTFAQDPGLMVMGCFLAYELRQPGWASLFVMAEAKQPDIHAMQELLLSLATYAFYNTNAEAKDLESLRQFASLRFSLEYGRRGTRDQRHAAAQIAQRMSRGRRMRQLKELGEQSAIEG